MSTMEQKKNKLIQTVGSDHSFLWALVHLEEEKGMSGSDLLARHAVGMGHAKNPV